MVEMMVNENGLPSEKNNLDPENTQPVIKVTRKRWIILIIYILYATLSSLQWIQYSIISNIMERYYNISTSSVDWTSLIYMIMWPIMVFPASYIIDKTGLRITGLIGAFATAIGACIKIFSIGQDLFYVAFIGQTIAAISQIFILSLPPKLAVTWFKPEEVSTACSLGIFGMTCGSALGFLLPPMIIKDHKNLDDIGSDMNIFAWIIAVSSATVAFMVVFYFPSAPTYPPSQAMYQERQNRKEVTLKLFFKSIIDLVKNKAFLIHTVAYACNLGIYSAIGTLLNQFVLFYLQDAQEDAGRMGLCLIVFGMVGSTLAGLILDKTRKFKETSVIAFLLTTVSLVGFLFALESDTKWIVYLAISIFGFFLNSYLPCGFELAMELTYPSPESTVTGLLFAISQMFGVGLTIVLSKIMESSKQTALIVQVAVLAVGSVLTFLTPKHLKRQAAFNKEIVFERVPMDEKSTK